MQVLRLLLISEGITSLFLFIIPFCGKLFEVTFIIGFVLDLAIGEIFKACEETGYVMMVTADHGNAEQMYSKSGGPHTAHTTNRGT